MYAESRGVADTGRPRWTGADWVALVESGVRRAYDPGQRILLQGDEGRWVAALIAGRVKILYAGPAGDEVLLAIRGPGDLLGEFAFGDHETRSATVQAMEPCIVSTVSCARFTHWVHSRRLETRLSRYMLAKTRESATLVWQMAHYRPAQRLADLVLTVIAVAGSRHPAPNTVPMSQDELARSIGLSRSSVTPILADWKRRQIVTIERAQLTVTDVPALRRAREPGSAAV